MAESRQLARIIVPAEAAQGDLVDLLVASSKGNPLFIVEAVAMLNDLGLTAAGADLQELPTAAALGPLVSARVHALQGVVLVERHRLHAARADGSVGGVNEDPEEQRHSLVAPVTPGEGPVGVGIIEHVIASLTEW